MQQWEYTTLLRRRGWSNERLGKGLAKHGFILASPWQHFVEDKRVSDNLDEVLAWLGGQGWEMVAMSPSAGILAGEQAALNNSYDFAGFTDQETWVFKRPKQ